MISTALPASIPTMPAAVRAALVRTESIGAAGKELGYAPLVRMSKGEQQGLERAHDVILADCFDRNEVGIKTDLIEEYWPEN